MDVMPRQSMPKRLQRHGRQPKKGTAPDKIIGIPLDFGKESGLNIMDLSAKPPFLILINPIP
jgi:hypothetical protein